MQSYGLCEAQRKCYMHTHTHAHTRMHTHTHNKSQHLDLPSLLLWLMPERRESKCDVSGIFICHTPTGRDEPRFSAHQPLQTFFLSDFPVTHSYDVPCVTDSCEHPAGRAHISCVPRSSLQKHRSCVWSWRLWEEGFPLALSPVVFPTEMSSSPPSSGTDLHGDLAG